MTSAENEREILRSIELRIEKYLEDENRIIKYPFDYVSLSRLISYLGLKKEDHKERLEKVMRKFDRQNMVKMQRGTVNSDQYVLCREI